MKLKKLIPKEILIESSGVHQYGCAMLYFNFPEIFKLQDVINPKDVYEDPNDTSYGLDDEPHITLLYGLHDEVSVADISNIIQKFVFSECIMYNSSLFQNDNYDVLKFDVRYPTKGGAFLHKCNNELSKLPNTNSYPDYHPHMTIGYLKPGTGQRYADHFNKIQPNGYTLVPSHVVYSNPDGTKNKISIRRWP